MDDNNKHVSGANRGIGIVIAGAVGALLGALLAALVIPNLEFCWNIIIYSDCFEKGSTESLIVGAGSFAVIGGGLGAFFANEYLVRPTNGGD